MKNTPKTEEEYFSLLKRIVNGAEYLDNPLIKPEDYAKGMKLYDALCSQATEYHKATREPLGNGTGSTAA